MPSDITGTDIIQEDTATGRRQMVFAPGPIFANIVLADEINRTPPKTQSALLEAMQEHRVTIQGRTYKLDEPFYVFATQNPIELEGTYPLPEAQLDRFMFHIVIEHPPEDEEFDVVRTTTAIIDPQFERPVTGDGSDRVPAAGAPRAGGRAGDALRAAAWCAPAGRSRRTRPESVKKWVAFGASVRAAQYLVLGAKARALTSGRYHVSFDDIRAHGAPGAAPPRADELPRRVGRRSRPTRSIDELLEAVPVPTIGNVEARWRGARVRDRLAFTTRIQRRHMVISSQRIPGARFVDPDRARAHRQPRAAGAARRRRLHQRPAPRRRTSARRSTSPSTAATSPATTSAASTGGCTRGPIATTSRSTRPTPTPTSRCCSTSRSRWGSAAAASRSSNTRKMLAGVPRPIWCTGSATASASSRSTTTSSTHVPPSAKHFDVVLHTLDRLKPSSAGQPARAAAQDGRALRPPRHAGADLRFLRGAGRDARGDRAAAVPRQRPDRVPRARPGGDRLQLRRRRRASRISRAASRFRWCPRRWPSSTAR